MKNIRNVFLVYSILLSFGSNAQVQLVPENATGISNSLQFEIDITKDPALGFVPKSRLVNAYSLRKVKVDQLNSEHPPQPSVPQPDRQCPFLYPPGRRRRAPGSH